MVTFADADWKTVNMEIVAMRNSEGMDVLYYSTEDQHMAFNSYKHIRLAIHLHKNAGERGKR